MKGRITVLDDLGDMSAPPGSRPRAKALQVRMRSCLREATATAMEFEVWASELQRYEGWKQLTDEDGRPFPSYERFCCAPPPFGLGYSVADIEAIVGERRKREARELAADPRVKPLADKPGRPSKAAGNGSVATIPSKDRGASYLVRRLKRDFPEIAEALARGEYKSARAAAIAAGVVKVPTLLDLFARLWSKASPEERRAIRKAVAQ